MKLVVLISLLFSLASCSYVEQGKAGIVTTFSGRINDDIRTSGFEFVVLDSMQTIDLTQNIVHADNVTARDADSIPLQELDANLTFDTNPEKVIAFYKKTKSIARIKDENGNANDVLGYNILQKAFVNELQKSVARFKSKDITSNRVAIEDEIKEALQKTINEQYGDIFRIVRVNLNTIKLNADIEKSLQLIQVTRNQQLEIKAQQEQVAMRKELLDAEMKVKAEVASRYGIGMRDYLDYEVRKDFNKAIGNSNANLQIHVGGK
jgi:hypothetical protein